MESHKQLSTITDVQQLKHVGFSQEQIVYLERARDHYQQGADHERKRQEFIRWLYLQGRLQS